MHRPQDTFLVANQSNIECISWNATGGAGHHREGSQPWFMLVMGPKQGKKDVSQQDVADCRARQNEQPSSFHGISLRLSALLPHIWPPRTGYTSQTTPVYAKTEGDCLEACVHDAEGHPSAPNPAQHALPIVKEFCLPRRGRLA